MLGKPSPSTSVLIVTEESGHGERLASAVRGCKLSPMVCGTLDQAQEILAHQHFAAVLCEETPSAGDFSSVIAQLERLARKAPVIAVSRRDDWKSYMIALDAGAADYVAFPPYKGEVERSLRKAYEATRSGEKAA
jgi:DNA-binding NtrC family response regulator